MIQMSFSRDFNSYVGVILLVIPLIYLQIMKKNWEI